MKGFFSEDAREVIKDSIGNLYLVANIKFTKLMVYEGFTGIRTKIKLLAFKLLIKRQGIVPDVIIYGPA